MHPVRSVLGGDGGHPDRYASEPLDPGASTQGSHGRAAARGPGEGEDFSQTDVSAASPAIAVGPSASRGDRQSSGSPRPRARASSALASATTSPGASLTACVTRRPLPTKASSSAPAGRSAIARHGRAGSVGSLLGP
jgi:hypothetical protein